MKNLAVIVFLVFPIFISYGQSEDKGKAIVKRRQGIEVYILSEPVRPYEVTGTISSDDASSILGALSDEKDCRNVVEQIDVLINNALRKQKKGKFAFDAIITENGTKGTCIKFTDTPEKDSN
jgi:hypothetical protein